MKKFILITALLAIVAGYGLLSCQQPATPGFAPEKAIAKLLVAQTDSFAAAARALQVVAESPRADERRLQDLFLLARIAYKKFEWAAEYFVPATSRAVNGPPVEEVEPSGQVFEPAGLQVIEALLFPGYDTAQKKELIRQLDLLQPACGKFSNHFTHIDIFDWQVFDAAKLEIFRIETLGITGFDNPLTLRSMEESAASLGGLREMLALYEGKADGREALHGDAGASVGRGDSAGKGNDAGLAGGGGLAATFNPAIRYLREHDDFNSFDRAEFITDYGNPLSISVSGMEERLKIHVIKYNRLLNQEAKTLFDSNAFHVDAYAPDPSSFISDEKVALGKTLFADPILSGTGTRSCQSCHQPGKAFSDGLVKNTIIGNHRLLKRNTPTLLNSALQPSLFYDLRVNRLEEQSLKVVQSSEEMHGSLKASVERLWQDTMYRRLFSAAFPRKDRAGIDTLEVMNAIGSYVRSLVFLNSRFDEYMRGRATAMNAAEINGFNLFMGKAKCATCHYMPLFNGTFPPRFVRIEAEVIGVPESASHKNIDPDMGRYEIVKVESFRHAFKTPTVRNAARTAPYMHNGVFSDLRQVMDFYIRGGGAGLGLSVPNQTLPFDKLALTDKERDEIIAFIGSLDSRY